MPDSLAGRLLVATPNIEDPNFRRTVVLLCAHEEEGAFGIVLNRPVEEPLTGMYVHACWVDRAAEPRVFFAGGPVSGGNLFPLGASDDLPGDRWALRVGPGLGLVDLSVEQENLDRLFSRIRVFAGCAGWAPGQLEAEIARHDWFTVDALPTDPFTPDPAELWREVLRRQGGELARFATHPDHPNVN